MSLFLPPTAPILTEWVRKAATAVNALLTAREAPFQQLSAAPSSPRLAQTYYDTTLNKVRTWDGAAWNNHW